MSPEQLKAHDAASRRGVIEGTLVSGTVALAGSYWAQRRFPAYQRLPLSLKALGVIVVVLPCLSIQGERRGLEYDRSQWFVFCPWLIFLEGFANYFCFYFEREGASVRLLDDKEVQEAKMWDRMSLSQKIGDWGFRHQYSIIMGGWAGSLAIAGAIISRQK